jgi:hypothetical protein
MNGIRRALESGVLLAVALSAPAQQKSLDIPAIEKATGVKGAWNEEEAVFRVSAPRTDLSVTVAGVRMNPALGLTSWAAFHKVGTQTMVMGDLVLLEDQVSPVMDAALQNGLEVTALHNHFLWDTPRVMFLHIGGMGSEVGLAEAVGKVLSRIRETTGGKGGVIEARIDPAGTKLDTDGISSVLKAKGDLKDGVYKVTIGRTTRMHGYEVGNPMGVNTWAAFAGADQEAVVDGDFVMRPSELQRVLKALRAGRINVVAIHNHMVEEEPRTVFLHYWGIGPAASLAKGVRAALEECRAD